MPRHELELALREMLVPTAQASATTLGTTVVLSVVTTTASYGACVCFEITLIPGGIPPVGRYSIDLGPKRTPRCGLSCTWPTLKSGHDQCAPSRLLWTLSVGQLLHTARNFVEAGPPGPIAVVFRFRSRGWRVHGAISGEAPVGEDSFSWVRDGHQSLVQYIDRVLGGLTSAVAAPACAAEGMAPTHDEGRTAAAACPASSPAPPKEKEQPRQSHRASSTRRKRPAPGTSPRPHEKTDPLNNLLKKAPLTGEELLEEARWWKPRPAPRRRGRACKRGDDDVAAVAAYVRREIRAQGGVEGDAVPTAVARKAWVRAGGGDRTSAASPSSSVSSSSSSSSPSASASALVANSRSLLGGCSVNDLGMLLGEEWLSSNVFSALLPLLSLAVMERGTGPRQCALLDCAQAGLGIGLGAGPQARADRVKALRGVWALPATLERVLLPWNVGGEHWVLVGVDAVYKQVVVANTLAKGSPRGGLKRPIGNLFREVFAWPPASQSLTDFTWKFPTVAQQSDSHSCGVLVLALLVDNLLQPWDPAHGERDWSADIGDRVTESWIKTVSRSRDQLFRLIARTATSESPPVSNNDLLQALWQPPDDAAKDDRKAKGRRTRGASAK